MSDEELLLRYMVPQEDLDAAYAAGPVKPGYDFHDTMTMRDLVEHALSLKRPRHIHISSPAGSVTVGGGAG